MKGDKITTHPCFGIARFSRVMGHSGFMFGSDIQSENFIELSIDTGERSVDDCGTVRFFHHRNRDKDSNIVTVKMTQTQFAELLTNMNVGDGIPVTIVKRDGEYVEQLDWRQQKPHLQELKEQFLERSKDILRNLLETEKRLNKLIDKKTLSKEDQREMRSEISRYITEIRSNMPFFIKVYKEETNDVLQRARTEIDAALQGAVIKAGIKALGLNVTSLPEEGIHKELNSDKI